MGMTAYIIMIYNYGTILLKGIALILAIACMIKYLRKG